MDALDRLYPEATDLLNRIDSALLFAGAPPDHPVWTLARRVGLTPGEAVAQVAGWAPERIREPVSSLRRAAESCRTDAASLPAALDSRGAAAQAYQGRRAELVAALDEGPDSLAERLDATASYLDDAASWAESTRDRVATAIAACLGAREAVMLRSVAVPGADAVTAGLLTGAGPPSTGAAGNSAPVIAAADLGAHLLDAVATGLTGGWTVHARWIGAIAPAPAAATSALDLTESTGVELR